jgi:hypothetical protein
VISSANGEVDEVRTGEVSSMASTGSSFSSWNTEEKLLEELQAPVCFG